MKPLIAIISSLLLCSCADMYVTKSQVSGGGRTGAIDTKDYGSRGVHMITNCGVGRPLPKRDLRSSVLRRYRRVPG